MGELFLILEMLYLADSSPEMLNLKNVFEH